MTKFQFKRTAGKVLSIALPIASSLGVVGTSILTAKATPKAIEFVREESEKKREQGEEFSKRDAFKAAWKCYIPAAVSGLGTIACIIGGSLISGKQQANLIGAYALLNRTYNSYREKVAELYGADADKDIVQSIAVEKCRNVTPYATGCISSSTLDFGGEEETLRLFYDSFSQRYFESTVWKVIQAEYHLNRNFALGGEVGLNDFYEFLGLPPLQEADELGWFVNDELYWVDFNHYISRVDDGTNGDVEVYVIDMVFTPTTGEEL